MTIHNIDQTRGIITGREVICTMTHTKYEGTVTIYKGTKGYVEVVAGRLVGVLWGFDSERTPYLQDELITIARAFETRPTWTGKNHNTPVDVTVTYALVSTSYPASRYPVGQPVLVFGESGHVTKHLAYDNTKRAWVLEIATKRGVINAYETSEYIEAC